MSCQGTMPPAAHGELLPPPLPWGLLWETGMLQAMQRHPLHCWHSVGKRMREIQTAQRKTLFCLSASIALSQLHWCRLGYGEPLKNKLSLLLKGLWLPLMMWRAPVHREWADPWLSEVTATRNTQLRALLQHALELWAASEAFCSGPLPVQ